MFVEEYLKQLRARRFVPRAMAHYVAKCARRSLEDARRRPAAVRGVLLAGVLYLVLILAVAVILDARMGGTLAREYLLMSVGWLAGGLLWAMLHLGMFPAEEPLPRSGFGLPNILTLGRLLCIPAFLVFIGHGHHLLALIAFLAGGLSDVADGLAARWLHATTRMGKIFDPLVDILFNAGVATGLAQAGYLPGWLLALILLRYGLLFFGAGLIYVIHGPVAVRPTVLGRATGLVTTGLVLAVVVVHRFLEGPSLEQALAALYPALGFVFLLTLFQAVVMGWFNIRHAGEEARSGALAAIVGRGEDPAEDGDDPAEGDHVPGGRGDNPAGRGDDPAGRGDNPPGRGKGA
jgi:cardiolipin synthase